MTNHLAKETSPYLLQHADNPVDWHPWSDSTLDKAKQEDKPILLSVGYSACHWCHVMAHESFEDVVTADLMNELFVNIKIDREERPDLDKIYQTAHQMLIQKPGGWPLTMFLTPDDQTPFFGGTYFPKEARHGLPAFTDLLTRIAAYYREHGDEIAQQKASIQQVFARLNPDKVDENQALNDTPLKKARQELEQQFDDKFGGFGGAPKFPHPTNIERLLRDWRLTADTKEPDLEALFMATYSLKRMALGGVYDQIGGGFCRYSVDQYWMIPHFEKMLYDNGPLLALCSEVWRTSGDELFRRVANETADWVLREMQSDSGGYYSTLDADSEGVEGKFYVWSKSDVERHLDKSDFELFSQHFGLEGQPNFEGEHHLHVFKETEQIAKDMGIPEPAIQTRINRARGVLLAQREQRVRPGRDEKVLTSWNGLMIRGMAIAANALERDELADSATRALDFIKDKLWHSQRLLATFKDQRSRFPAYLDDYVFLMDGILELLQVRWRTQDFLFLQELADVVIEQFEDKENSGFFFTANDHESLLYRPKTYSDEAIPAGNGVAAKVLARLGYLLGNTKYIQASENTLRSAWKTMESYPHAHGAMLLAIEEMIHGIEIVIIRGHGEELKTWHKTASYLYTPRRMVFAIPSDCKDLPQSLADKGAMDQTVAYLCHGTTCSPPILAIEDLARIKNET